MFDLKFIKSIIPGAAKEGGYLEIWRIAYPLIIMSASNTIMQFCDRKFLALNSTEDVAAALPAGVLTFTLFSFFMVTVNFTSALVSQYFGKQDKAACVRSVWNGFYFGLFAAAIILFIIPWIGLTIINMGGHSGELLTRERSYYISMIPSGAFVCLGGAFGAYFSGQGKTGYIAVVNVFSCLVNIGLDYIMIFGKLGCPAMGIAGAGIATSIATFLSFAILMLLFLTRNQEQYPTRKHREFRMEYIKRLLKFGTPAGLQCFLEVGAFTTLSFLIGKIGQTEMAVTTIVLSIDTLSFLPLLGLGDATSIVSGQYIGRGKRKIVWSIAARSWIIATCYMTISGLIFVLFPEWLIGQFAPAKSGSIDFDTIVQLGRTILICAAIFNFFDATKFVFMGALRGAGDTRMILIICVSCAWGLMIPGILIIILVLKMSLAAVWIFMTFHLGIEATMVFFRFLSGRWKNINMIERENISKGDLMQSSQREIILPID